MKTKTEKRVYKVVDIGYGYLKFPKDNEVHKEKAVVARLTDSLNPGESKGIDVINVDGQDYIVGDAVYKLGRKPMIANEHTGRPQQVAYKVLALYALAKTYDPADTAITFLTGLPFQNLDEADVIKEIFTREHTVILNGREITLDIDEALVSSQGLGTYYSIVRQRGGVILAKKILIVDLGFHTINYLYVNNGDVDVSLVKTNRDLGIQNAYTKIADAVNVEFKKNYKFYDVDDLLDNGVPQHDVDKGNIFVPIIDRPYVQDALAAYAEDVWSDISDKYNDKQREQLDEVIFAGGTAERVKDHLLASKKLYCSIAEDAQDVQVLGYAELANKVEQDRNK